MAPFGQGVATPMRMCKTSLNRLMCELTITHSKLSYKTRKLLKISHFEPINENNSDFVKANCKKYFWVLKYSFFVN